MEIEKKVRELIEPIITQNNFLLDQVVYEKEGNIQFLRIIIDKNGIVDVDDCVTVTNYGKLHTRRLFQRERL